MKKLSLLAASVAIALTGCGGSDGGSSTDDSNNIGASTLKVQVIDGYLVNAEVYVDRNGNNVADADEKLDTTTDSEGYITVAESDKDYALIARAVAGKTFDTDKGGAITSSYELTAPAGAAVVNPYTTLAVIENKTIDQVATELNIDSSLISGDYVKAKSGSNAEEAKKAHAIARSLTLTLEDTIAESTSNIEAIKTDLDNIQTQVNAEINNGTDLDTIIVKDGEATAAPKTVEQALVGNTFDAIPTNSYYFEEEGVYQFTFASESISILDDYGNPEDSMSISYTSTGYLTADGDHEEVLFLADDFYLSITPQNDLVLMANSTLGINENGYPQDTSIAASDFTGKTLYHFWDDSDSSTAVPSLAKFEFNSTGTVTVSEMDAQGNWVVSGSVDWSVTDAQLIMDVPEEAGKQFNWSFTTLQQDGLTIAYDSRWIPLFFTENEDLATGLYLKWMPEATDETDTTKEYLVGNKYDVISTNGYYLEEEGVYKFTFSSDSVTLHDDYGNLVGSMPISYTSTGYNTEDGHDEIVFLADDFYLAVTSQNDLALVANSTLGISANGYPEDTSITASDFAGKTLYHFWDDSTSSSAEPSFAKLTFNSDGTFVVSEYENGAWVEYSDSVLNWEVTNAQLVMDVPGEAGKQFNWSFTTIQQDGLRIAYDENWVPLFFSEDENLATSLFQKWIALAN